MDLNICYLKSLCQQLEYRFGSTAQLLEAEKYLMFKFAAKARVAKCYLNPKK